jgi:hypothetical protein
MAIRLAYESRLATRAESAFSAAANLQLQSSLIM